MNRKKRQTLYLIFTLVLMAVLVGYRIYLFVRETDYQAINAKNIDRIETRLHGGSGYRFAVVGNIRNSMRIFESRITPLMNDSSADFMISLGNAVYDGAEGKYRLLYRGLKKLDIPYLMAVGHNEVEDFGAREFYGHFGPYFFSFHVENACFIFLDSTGHTSWEWQMRWLRQELTAAKQSLYRFVFLNHSVFSLPGFDPKDTHYSFLYMSLFNALLILSIISLVALKLYAMILRQESLYRDFSVDETVISPKPLRVAMFTNNYLPFIGGVPLSIDRLYRGLVQAGEAVTIFAPAYPEPWVQPEDGSVVRCPALFSLRLAGFPVANVSSREIKEAFAAFECDLVHVHHPFWLGKKGMHLAKKSGLPVVFTYHTRLERYTHYLPFPGAALKNLAAHLLIKRFANHCDAIITPTPSTEEYLRNLGVSALIETIPTGIGRENYNCWTPQQVQTLRSRYTPAGESLLISVSRMAREKNLEFLIDGLAKVKKQIRIPFKCLLVGEGPEKKRLEEKAAALGLNEQVVFTGYMTPRDVARYYLAADLFVFASTSETQGMVLIEAMAGGCPVVAVRASGVHDVVKDGYNGLMVAESTESWSKAVATLLADHQQLAVLSENSRAFAEDYSEEKIAARVLRLYRRVVVLGKSKAN